MEMPWNEWQELVLTARLIALDHLKALEKDSKDRAAISYFHGLEFKRWFSTPAKEAIEGVTVWNRKPIAVAKSLHLVEAPPPFAIKSKPARHCKQCGVRSRADAFIATIAKLSAGSSIISVAQKTAVSKERKCEKKQGWT